jgi:AbrB family looped-hinge helix DNA binding protein
MKTTVSSKGQLVLPAELRQQDHIAPGQRFEVERVKEGEYLFKKLEPPKLSVMEWLRACPEKDWFRPIPSENTNTISGTL